MTEEQEQKLRRKVVIVEHGLLCSSPKPSPDSSSILPLCFSEGEKDHNDTKGRNPFGGPTINQISRKTEIEKMRFYTWHDERRTRGEVEGSFDIGHARMRVLFGNPCPPQDLIKCKSISITDWHKDTVERLYGKYNKDDEDIPSTHLVFKILVFAPTEEDNTEHLFISEITIRRQSLASLPVNIEKTVELMDLCEVKWKHCLNSKVETEKRVMSFADVVKETCASVCARYPSYYCHYSLEFFSLGVYHSDTHYLEQPIPLPSCINSLDHLFNKVICSDTEDYFVPNDGTRPMFSVLVERKNNSSITPVETLTLEDIFMFPHDKQVKHIVPKGTIINGITLLGLNLVEEVLPLVFDHIQHCCSILNGINYTITGTFSSMRGERVICFTNTNEYRFTSMPADWAKKQVASFARALFAANQELCVSRLPIVL